MSSITKPFLRKVSPVVVEIESFENTTKNIVDVDVDVDANNTNTNTNTNVELARMKDEIQQLRRDRDHWRETAISNLAIETSTLMTTKTKTKTRSSSSSSSNSENNRSNNNRKRHGVPFGCDNNDNNDNNNNNNFKGIKQFRSQYPTSTDATFTSDAAAAATAADVAQQVDEDDETITKTTDGTLMMRFESTTTTNKRLKRMSKDDIQKSFHLMEMERHLKSAMIYASKGDKNLMLYSIKQAEKHASKKNSDDDTSSSSSSSSSSCNNEIFLNKVTKIKQTINKDIEKLFHKNIMERQLRSAMAYAIRGDKSTMEYLLKEAKINARKCCCNDINRVDDNDDNDDNADDGNDGDYSYKFFQERVIKIQEEIKRTIHGQHAL
jgi:hypothetical protein